YFNDYYLKLRKRVILNEVKNLKPQIRAIFRCFASLNMTKSQFCVTSVIIINYIVIGNICISQAQDELIENFVVSQEVDSLLRYYRLPEPRLDLSKEEHKDKNKIKEVEGKYIVRAEEMLTKGLVPNNNEFQTYFYGKLGVSYLHKEEYDKSIYYFNKAIEKAKTIQPDLQKAYIAGTEIFLIDAYSSTNKYLNALQLAKKFIVQYQGIGKSRFKNSISVYGVRKYVNAAKGLGWSVSSIEDSLQEISNAYANEVGCAADFQLLLLAKEQKDDTRVKQLKNRILTRYPKTWEYTIIYESYFDAVLK
ncbi:MAG: hypothetical protein Q8K98_06770, partial [Bacteroidota bacterium]|nr:hypothetical protein [Bacteroidota bacterium]